MHAELDDSPPAASAEAPREPAKPSPVLRHTWPRRLARACVRPLARTRVSPNQITILRVAIGLAACALLATGTPTADRAAAVLWLLAMFLDRCDGEFARMTGRTTPFGHRLDYASDVGLSALFFLGTGIGARHGDLGGWAVPMGVAAAIGVALAQILAEAIDQRQADRGEKAFPGLGGFDFEDAMLLFAPLVWLGWHVWFVAAASVGAPLFAVFTLFLLRRRFGAVARGPVAQPVGRTAWTLATLAVGGIILFGVVRTTDLGAVGMHLVRLDLLAIAVLLGVYLLRTVADAVAWHATLPSLPMRPRQLYALWTVLMAGSALERSTPLAGLGGEPLKALVMSRRHGIPVEEVTASLILTRTTDVLALVLLVMAGLALAVDMLTTAQATTALVAFGGLVAVALGFVVAQRARLVSRLRDRFPPAPDGRIARVVRALVAVEDAVGAFHRRCPGRFASSIGASICELAFGVLAVHVALAFLEHPAELTDALAIEAIVLLVTATFFFVPGNLGTQEGALVLACEAILGAPAVGLALAAIRRGRDIVWVAGGLGLASWYSLRLPALRGR